jgi:hypothetical protein
MRFPSHRTTVMTDEVEAGETYAGAGVSIDAGEEAVDRIKSHVRSTFRPEVIGDIGGFGGVPKVVAAEHNGPKKNRGTLHVWCIPRHLISTPSNDAQQLPFQFSS